MLIKQSHAGIGIFYRKRSTRCGRWDLPGNIFTGLPLANQRSSGNNSGFSAQTYPGFYHMQGLICLKASYPGIIAPFDLDFIKLSLVSGDSFGTGISGYPFGKVSCCLPIVSIVEAVCYILLFCSRSSRGSGYCPALHCAR